MILSPHEIAWLVIQHWTDPADQRIAVAVALAESGGDTDVMGRSRTGDNVGQRDHGLFQISGRWHGAKLQANPDWRDPRVNTALAYDVWRQRRGDKWEAWSVYSSGRYRDFLPDADHGLAAPFPPPAPVDLAALFDAVGAQVNAVAAQVAEIRNHFA